MDDDAELWRFIALLPIAGRTAVPLHRVLARTMWRGSTLATVRYDADQDQVLIQMIDAPTVAEVVIYDPDRLAADGQVLGIATNGQFIGFDGVDQDAWPTVIAMLDFRRQRQSGDVAVMIMRKLCGEHIWQAALAAAYDGVSKSAEVFIGTGESSMLIDRWRNLLAPPGATEISHEDLRRAFDGWIATHPDRFPSQFSGHPAASPNHAGGEQGGWPGGESS